MWGNVDDVAGHGIQGFDSPGACQHSPRNTLPKMNAHVMGFKLASRPIL